MRCELYLNSLNVHLQQVYTGFSELAQKGVFSSFKVYKNSKEELKHVQTLLAIVNGVRIVYDVRDDYNIPKEYLDFEFDYYFKRGCSKDYVREESFVDKVFPLGFNYVVSSGHNFGVDLNHIIKFPGIFKNILRQTIISEWLNNFRWSTCYYDSIERMPSILSEPKILFLSRTWDPDEIEPLDKREERRYINDTRVKCIELCRKEFGDLFIGGISSSDFSCRHYKDYCTSNPKNISKKRYFNLLDKSSICIATMGLHKSIGWKMGEYIAKSKAIVSEEFIADLPGDFKEDQNYLSFKQPDELVDKVQRLVDEPSLRRSMMFNNWLYYQQNLRPDMLIYNTLYKVFEEDLLLC